jgi:hypothetical protein
MPRTIVRAVRRRALALVWSGLGLLAVVGSAVPAHAQSVVTSPELEKARTALEKYKDPVAAVHDGYFSTVGCVHFPQAGGVGRIPYPAGGMGVHFLNPALIGPVPDPLRPQILLYEPDGDKLRLVAAEWFIPLQTGIKERPQLFGHPFDGPMEGHHPLMPTAVHHYDLHVWLFKPNPAGIFSPTNPAVQCGGYGYSLGEESPKAVPHQ